MAQFARPDSNVTQASFTGGFAEIDEASPSDADFAWGTDNTAAELEVGLGNVTDPALSTGHTFRYRIAKTNDGVVDGAGSSCTVTARLMQGATQIATDTAKTATGTWTQYAYTLSSGEADAITDYTDLRLEFLTSASGGNPTNRRGAAVSWAELEVPDAVADTALAGSAAGSSSAAGDLSTEIALAGSSAGASTAAGDLATGIALAGASAGASTALGDLTTQIPLAGSAAGAATGAGDLSTQIALAGSAQGTSTAGGAMNGGGGGGGGNGHGKARRQLIRLLGVA